MPRYPSELEERVTLADGTPVLVRPVRPEDEPAFRAGFAKLTPRDVRMRFFAYMKALPHAVAARLTRIDYDREMAFVAFGLGPEGAGAGSGAGAGEETGEVLGVVRLAADPDSRRGEYAVIVRSDMQRRGLGHVLMDRIIAHARRRGVGEIFGHVLEENAAMLAMCREYGFTIARTPDDPGVMRVTLALSVGEAAAEEGAGS